jgi:hypothetical protein
MAVKTTWRVRHRCGHQIDWNLSDKQPAERAGFAAWLAQRDCTRCWWAKRRTPDRQARAAARIRRRADQAAAMTAWETRTGLPALHGSDKAVRWARQIRYRLLRPAPDDHHLADGDRPAADLNVRLTLIARRVTSASWWIGHRATNPRAIEELLANATRNSR